MADTQAAGSLERPKDAGKGKAGDVKRWLLEIELADKEEEDWRKRARETVERYRDEAKGKANNRKGASRFNILWANTEVMRPSMYSNTPRPDVRRRYRDPDPAGKAVAEIIERACTYALDVYDFDHVMDLAVLDYLLPGRAVTRVRYTPMKDENGEVVNEKAECEHWAWERFRRGPGAKWSDVPWLSFEHLLTREELDDLFPGKKIELDVELAGEDARTEKHDLFKRGRVYEIWHKDTRKVIWIAPSNKDEPVKVEDDPLKLRGFYDIPRPLYSLVTSDSLVPVEEFRNYKDQADELDEITNRIRRLVSALKVRGIYDATLKEVSQLLESGDNQMIPSTGAQNVLAQTQTLDRHIWMLPIDTIARVLVGLYEQRDQLKQVIYEITGLSDILRGSTDPNETLGAQQLKAQTGSLRVQKRQREVQRYARDLIEMKAEIMAEHFSPQTLQMMTGVPIDPEALELLKGGGLRDYRIDIETDSTISADSQADQENVSKLLQGIAGYFDAVGPAVQSGLFPVEAAKSILISAVRKFKMGREVEDKLEDMGANQQQDPAAEQQKQAEQQQLQEQMQQQATQQAEQSVAQEREAIKLKQAEIQMQIQSAQKDNAMGKEQLALQSEKANLTIDKQMAALEAKRDELDAIEQRIHQAADELNVEDDHTTERTERIGAMEGDMKEMAQALSQLAQALVQGLEQNQQGTQALLAAMSAPKELIRDDKGRVTGARTRLDS